jgi:hypothetical protein
MASAEGRKPRNHFRTKFNRIEGGDVHPEELEKIKQAGHLLPNHSGETIEYIVRIAGWWERFVESRSRGITMLTGPADTA